MSRPYVTVVSGPPRSGTSLAMQMLEAGGIAPLADGARPPDAGNPRGYYELAAVKRLASGCDWLDRARGRAVKVVHALVTQLPLDAAGYRVLWMQRDPWEVARSQHALLALLGHPPADGLAEARVAEILAAQLREAAAALDARDDVRRRGVRHADLLARPDDEIARIDAFLDGGLDRSAMRACIDPALHRVRRSEPAAT